MKRKTFAVLNNSSETIPAYGVMRLEIDEDPYVTESAGQLVWNVDQPDDDAAERQDPSLLLINGPVPIRAGTHGTWHCDWPVRAQLAAGNMSAGDLCGPASGEWTLAVDKSAFRLLSNDVLADLEDSSLHFGWIAPAYAGTVIVPAELDEALVSGGNANSTLLIGSARTTSGDSIVIRDVPTMITASYQIPNGTTVRTYYDSVVGAFVLLTPAACEEAQ